MDSATDRTPVAPAQAGPAGEAGAGASAGDAPTSQPPALSDEPPRVSRTGPLRVARYRKSDGRQLILYNRVTDESA